MSSHIVPVRNPSPCPLRGFNAASGEVVEYHSLRNVQKPQGLRALDVGMLPENAVPVAKFLPFENNGGVFPLAKVISSRRFQALDREEKRLVFAAYTALFPDATATARRSYDRALGAGAFDHYWGLNAG